MSSVDGAAPRKSTAPPAASVVVMKGMADSVDLLPVTGPLSARPAAGGVGRPRGCAAAGTSWEKRFVRVDDELLLSAAGANQELRAADGDGVDEAGWGAAGMEWVLLPELCSRYRWVRR